MLLLAAGSSLLPAGGCQLGFGGSSASNLRPAGRVRTILEGLYYIKQYRGVPAAGRGLLRKPATGMCGQAGAPAWQVLLQNQGLEILSLSRCYPPKLLP